MRRMTMNTAAESFSCEHGRTAFQATTALSAKGTRFTQISRGKIQMSFSAL